MQLTYTLNGQPVALEGTPAEIAAALTTLAQPEAKAKGTKKAQPKAEAKAEAPVIERKLDELGDGPRALTRQTRRSFGKALKRLGDLDEAIVAELKLGEDPEHWSTKELATYAMATETVPAGYKVAGNYYQLLGETAKAARENAVKALKAPKQAPKGRVRDSKGRFVKQ